MVDLVAAHLALRNLRLLLLDMALRTFSRVLWLAVPLKVVLVLPRRLKSSKASLACLDTCRLLLLASTRLRRLLTTRSPTADSPKDLASMATVLNRRNRPLHQVQVSRSQVLVVVLRASQRHSRASRIRTQAHPV